MATFIAAAIIFGLMGLALSLGAILGRGGLKCHCDNGSCASDPGSGVEEKAPDGCCGKHEKCEHFGGASHPCQ